MSHRPTLIIISGAPSSGKTTLALFLAQELGLPIFSRDQLKEIIFNTVGWKHRKQVDQVGVVAYRLLDHLIVTELEAGKSCIVESHFDSLHDSARFQSWQKMYHFRCVQLICHAEASILLERFKERARSGGRHPGHADTAHYKALSKSLLENPASPLEVPSTKIEVDTSDFNQIDYAKIVGRIRKVVER